MSNAIAIPILLALLRLTPGVLGVMTKAESVTSCDSCRIVAKRIGPLVLRDGKGLPLPSSISEGPDGSIWYGTYDPGPPLRFSHSGLEEGKAVPSRLMLAFGAGTIVSECDRDSLIMFEPGLQRISIANSEGVTARTIAIEVQHGNAIACDGEGRFVVGGSVPTREKAGFPLHFLSPNGTILRSVSVGAPLSMGYAALNAQLVARAKGGGFWSIDAERNVLHQWAGNGELLQEFVRQVPWFPVRAVYPTKVSMTEPPLPTVAAIRQLADGSLLLLTTVAGAGWQQAVHEKTDQSGTRYATVTNFDKYVDTVVELVDGKTARTIAWHKLRGFFPYIVDDDEIAHVTPSAATGTAAVEIWHVNLNLTP